MRQAIQESYRRINPRGAVVDVEKQLNRQLAELALRAAPSLHSCLGNAIGVAGVIPDIHTSVGLWWTIA